VTFGQRFGKLTFVALEDRRCGVHRFATFHCDCGATASALVTNVRQGQTKSCGCFRKQKATEKRLAPGEATLNFLYDRTKRSALRRGIVFELALDEFKALAQKDCVYCGAPPAPRKQKTHYGAFVCNGIDRENNDRGYVKGNSVPCCPTCNFAKAGMTVDEFKAWIKRAHDHLGL